MSSFAEPIHAVNLKTDLPIPRRMTSLLAINNLRYSVQGWSSSPARGCSCSIVGDSANRVVYFVLRLWGRLKTSPRRLLQLHQVVRRDPRSIALTPRGGVMRLLPHLKIPAGSNGKAKIGRCRTASPGIQELM